MKNKNLTAIALTAYIAFAPAFANAGQSAQYKQRIANLKEKLNAYAVKCGTAPAPGYCLKGTVNIVQELKDYKRVMELIDFSSNTKIMGGGKK